MDIKFLHRILPILNWLPNYKETYLKGDLIAGLTVGIVLIPQGMAYAMLAGLEPIHGLYAATIPLLLYAVFGTSRHLAVGPDAIVSLLTAAGIAALNTSGAEEYFLYVITLTFLVGIIRLGMGIFRLGFVVKFLSNPVINGFTSAAAIIIGLSQLKHLLRINLPNSEHIQEVVLAIFLDIKEIHWLTLGIGLLGILIIKYGKRIHSSFPGALVAVFIGIALVRIFNLTDQGILIVGQVPGGLPGLVMPSFDFSLWRRLFPIALTIALVGFAQSFAIAKTIQARHKNYRLDADQELLGLGMANLGASFFQGYSVSGGFSRTAVNDNAGANTPLSSIISALLIILTLLFFTEVFYHLPSAILAAVVMSAVAGLIDIKEPLQLWKKDRSDFFMLIATFLLTLTLGIEIGIISGMGLSLLMVIYKASRPHMAQLGRVPGTKVFRNINRFDQLEVFEDLLMVRIDGPIYFANVEYIKDKMDRWIDRRNGKIKMIIFDMESVTSLDSTGAQALHTWIMDWRSQDIDICLTGTKGPVRDVLNRWELIECIGTDHMFLDDQTAVEFFGQKMDGAGLQMHSAYATQSNIKKSGD